MTAEEVIGVFDDLNLPSLNGSLRFNVVYGSDRVSLAVAVPEPACAMFAVWGLLLLFDARTLGRTE